MDGGHGAASSRPLTSDVPTRPVRQPQPELKQIISPNIINHYHAAGGHDSRQNVRSLEMQIILTLNQI
jgi:hypothetical protein